MARFLAVLVLVACAAAGACAQYFAGFAVRDISPTAEQMAAGEVWLGGYGFWKFRGRPTAVHDPVWARAMVLSANGTTIATALVDSTGISNRMLKEIRTGVNAATGIPEGNVLVGASHTHSGPDLQGLWGFVSDAYRQQVITAVVDAISEAFFRRESSRIFVSRGTGFANNRRGWGYTDDELTVLDVRSSATGLRTGAIIQFAAHPVTLGASNLEVSSDYCHYVRAYAEAELNATVIYFNGAIGDVSPQGTGSAFERADSYGLQIANIAISTMASQVEITEVGLLANTVYYVHPCTNPLFILADAVGLLDYDFNDEDNSVNMQTTYFRIGSSLQGVAFPGESLTNNALPIKEVMTAPYRLFLGLNGDTLGYFVPTAEWNARTGYEEKISISQFVGDFTRDLLVETIQADSF